MVKHFGFGFMGSLKYYFVGHNVLFENSDVYNCKEM